MFNYNIWIEVVQVFTKGAAKLGLASLTWWPYIWNKKFFLFLCWMKRQIHKLQWQLIQLSNREKICAEKEKWKANFDFARKKKLPNYLTSRATLKSCPQEHFLSIRLRFQLAIIKKIWVKVKKTYNTFAIVRENPASVRVHCTSNNRDERVIVP